MRCSTPAAARGSPGKPEQETPFLGHGSSIKGVKEMLNMVGSVPDVAGVVLVFSRDRPQRAPGAVAWLAGGSPPGPTGGRYGQWPDLNWALNHKQPKFSHEQMGLLPLSEKARSSFPAAAPPTGRGFSRPVTTPAVSLRTTFLKSTPPTNWTNMKLLRIRNPVFRPTGN